jgi:hypothetical protein
LVLSVVLRVLVLLDLMLLMLLRACGDERVLFQEHANHISSDFMVYDSLVGFAHNIDSEFLVDGELSE